MYDPTNRMSGSAQVAPRRQWISALELQFADLLRTSGAEGLGLAREEFHQILVQIGEKYLPADAGVEDARVLYQTLRVADLALARACAAGQEKAWEVFLTRFREKLYDAGRAIAGDDSRGRELADSIYAELYGLSEREGMRASKLASYTGRGSLDGWLRTVLAQEFVNRYRTQKRLVSLEEKEEDGVSFVHFSIHRDEENIIPSLPAFREFTAQLRAEGLAGEAPRSLKLDMVAKSFDL